MNLYYIIYKPYGMLSQFSREGEKPTLADLIFEFPKDVYPVGRLDADSEGLLILTNDKKLNNQLLDPTNKHKRTYYVQVEGDINVKALQILSSGVDISLNTRNYKTLPAEAAKIEEPNLPPRNPPIRYRKNVPDSWIKLTLTEGKNRQVRKMTAKVGFPTLRLVRYSIEKLSLGNMLSGDVVEVERGEMYNKLKL